MKKKKIGFWKLISIVISIALIAAIIFSVFIFNLALTDNYSEKYVFSAYDDTLMSETLKAAMIGIGFELTDEQINTYINQKFASNSENNNTAIEKIRIYTHKEFTDIYAKIKYRGYSTGIYCKAKIEYNNSSSLMKAKIYDFYIGELRISENILRNILPKLLENNDYVKVNQNKISIAADHTYKIDDYEIDLRLKSFSPDEGKISCRTNSLTLEALKVLKEYCTSDEGKQKIKEIFSVDVQEIQDTLTEILNEKISGLIPDSIKEKIESWRNPR